MHINSVYVFFSIRGISRDSKACGFFCNDVAFSLLNEGTQRHTLIKLQTEKVCVL